MFRTLLSVLLLFIAAGAWAQQPTQAPSHQYFGGPSLGMVYTNFCNVTGATPQTCNAMRGTVTTGTLTTAAATDTTPFVINNTFALASSVVTCAINAYSGIYTTNGNPLIESCVAGAGTITVNIRNVGTNALNGTLELGFAVMD
jgi:hypothetical protein